MADPDGVRWPSIPITALCPPKTATCIPSGYPVHALPGYVLARPPIPRADPPYSSFVGLRPNHGPQERTILSASEYDALSHTHSYPVGHHLYGLQSGANSSPCLSDQRTNSSQGELVQFHSQPTPLIALCHSTLARPSQSDSLSQFLQKSNDESMLCLPLSSSHQQTQGGAPDTPLLTQGLIIRSVASSASETACVSTLKGGNEPNPVFGAPFIAACTSDGTMSSSCSGQFTSTTTTEPSQNYPPDGNFQLVPWSWRRVISTEKKVFYVSPSGVEVRSVAEAEDYLLQDGTCKCGLECPLDVAEVFNFDPEKRSVLASATKTRPDPAKFCARHSVTAVMAAYEAGGYVPGMQNSRKVQHIHEPAASKKVRRLPRKKKPYANLIMTQRMREAKEAEERRINEIIRLQKQEHDARLGSDVIVGGNVNRGSGAPCDAGEGREDSLSTCLRYSDTANPVVETQGVLESCNRISSKESYDIKIRQHRQSSDSRTSTATSTTTDGAPSVSSVIYQDSDEQIAEEEGGEDEDDEQREADGLQNDGCDEDKNCMTGNVIKGVEGANINLEIRRLSSTEDGDRVLQSAWDDPNEDVVGGKDILMPLEMVKKVVSNISGASADSSGSSNSTPRGSKNLTPSVPGNLLLRPSLAVKQQSDRPPGVLQVSIGEGENAALTKNVQLDRSNKSGCYPPVGAIFHVVNNQGVNVSSGDGPMLARGSPSSGTALPGTSYCIVSSAGASSHPQAHAGIDSLLLTPSARPGASGKEDGTITECFSDATAVSERSSSVDRAAGSTKVISSGNFDVGIADLGLPVPQSTLQRLQAPSPGSNLVMLASAGSLSPGGVPSVPILLPQLTPPVALSNVSPNQQLFRLSGGGGSLLNIPAFVYNNSHPCQEATVGGALVQVQQQNPPVQSCPPSILTTSPGGAGSNPIVLSTPVAAMCTPVNQVVPSPGSYLVTPHGLVAAAATSVAGSILPTPILSSTLEQYQHPHPVNNNCVTLLNAANPHHQQQLSLDVSASSISPAVSSDKVGDKRSGNASSGEDADPILSTPDLSANSTPMPSTSKKTFAKKRTSKLSSKKSRHVLEEADREMYDDEHHADDNLEDAAVENSEERFIKKVKRKSVKISVQSNEVDSSGLKATPPHSADERLFCSPETIVSTSNVPYDSMDTSPNSTSLSTTTIASKDVAVKQPSSLSEECTFRRKRLRDMSVSESLSRNRTCKMVVLATSSSVQEETLLAANDHREVRKDENAEDGPDSSLDQPRQFSVGEIVWGPHGSFPSWPGKLVRTSSDGCKVWVCWFGNKDTTQVEPFQLQSLSDGLEAHHKERKKLRKGRKMNASLERAIQEAMLELD